MDNTKIESAKIDKIIGYILRIGVTISSIVILIGLLMYFFNGGSGYKSGYYPTSLNTIEQGISQGKSFAVIMLGLLLLISTPVLRVITSIVPFYLERDWTYVVITTIVLIILIISLFIGIKK